MLNKPILILALSTCLALVCNGCKRPTQLDFTQSSDADTGTGTGSGDAGPDPDDGGTDTDTNTDGPDFAVLTNFQDTPN